MEAIEQREVDINCLDLKFHFYIRHTTLSNEHD